MQLLEDRCCAGLSNGERLLVLLEHSRGHRVSSRLDALPAASFSLAGVVAICCHLLREAGAAFAAASVGVDADIVEPIRALADRVRPGSLATSFAMLLV